MAKRILTAIVFVLFAPYVEAAQCHFLPDLTLGEKWSWQWVDSKICWYQGEDSAPRQSLYWNAPAQAALPPAGETKAAKPRERTAATDNAVTPGEKIQCNAEPEGAGRWTWRTVEGKRCWYRGPHGTPRAMLHWPPQERNEAREAAGNKEVPRAAVEEPKRADVAALDRPHSDHAEDTEIAENAPALNADETEALEPWELVNPSSSGDVEFLAIGERVPVPFSMDPNVGTQFLTRTPMAFWPLPVRAPAN